MSNEINMVEAYSTLGRAENILSMFETLYKFKDFTTEPKPLPKEQYNEALEWMRVNDRKTLETHIGKMMALVGSLPRTIIGPDMNPQDERWKYYVEWLTCVEGIRGSSLKARRYMEAQHLGARKASRKKASTYNFAVNAKARKRVESALNLAWKYHWCKKKNGQRVPGFIWTSTAMILGIFVNAVSDCLNLRKGKQVDWDGWQAVLDFNGTKKRTAQKEYSEWIDADKQADFNDNSKGTIQSFLSELKQQSWKI